MRKPLKKEKRFGRRFPNNNHRPNNIYKVDY